VQTISNIISTQQETRNFRSPSSNSTNSSSPIEKQAVEKEETILWQLPWIEAITEVFTFSVILIPSQVEMVTSDSCG
jgi:hypothetical protein